MLLRFVAAAVAVALIAVSGAQAGTLSIPALTARSSFENAADTQKQVKTAYAHLRAKPTTKSDKLATLKHGTKVDVIDLVDHGKWAHVRVAGKTGYISANLLM